MKEGKKLNWEKIYLKKMLDVELKRETEKGAKVIHEVLELYNRPVKVLNQYFDEEAYRDRRKELTIVTN